MAQNMVQAYGREAKETRILVNGSREMLMALGFIFG